MATAEPTVTQAEIDELFSRAYKGDIANSSKAELERYAAMLCSVHARSHRRDPEFEQLGETIRSLLIVRMSEQANKEATRISQIALWVAMAAFGCAVIQLLIGLWQ